MHVKYVAKFLIFLQTATNCKLKHYELSILKPTTMMPETFTKMNEYSKISE